MENHFEKGSVVDATSVLGQTFVASVHSSGNGIDIINTDTGRPVQTISCGCVLELCWSSNSHHLCALIRRRAGEEQEQERFEILIFAIQEDSETSTWRHCKTLAAPTEYIYRGITFAFPLISLTALPNPPDNLPSVSQRVGDDLLLLMPINIAAVIVDIEIGSFHQVRFPEARDVEKGVDRVGKHTTSDIITVPYSCGKLSSSGGFLALLTLDLITSTTVTTTSATKAAAATAAAHKQHEQAITTYRTSGKPKLCVIDVFLSPTLPTFPIEPTGTGTEGATPAGGMKNNGTSSNFTDSRREGASDGDGGWDTVGSVNANASARNIAAAFNSDSDSEGEEDDDDEEEENNERNCGFESTKSDDRSPASRNPGSARGLAGPLDEDDIDDLLNDQFESSEGFAASMFGSRAPPSKKDGSKKAKGKGANSSQGGKPPLSPSRTSTPNLPPTNSSGGGAVTCTPSYVDLYSNKIHDAAVDLTAATATAVGQQEHHTKIVSASEFNELFNWSLSQPLDLGINISGGSSLGVVFSWRRSQASTAESNELLFTYDRRALTGASSLGGNPSVNKTSPTPLLKIWSVCRREPPAPFTTVVTSISGVGSSYIVCGDIGSSRNPKVTMLVESSIPPLVYESPPIPGSSSTASLGFGAGSVHSSTSSVAGTSTRTTATTATSAATTAAAARSLPTSSMSGGSGKFVPVQNTDNNLQAPKHSGDTSSSNSSSGGGQLFPVVVSWMQHGVCPSAESAYLIDQFTHVDGNNGSAAASGSDAKGSKNGRGPSPATAAGGGGGTGAFLSTPTNSASTTHIATATGRQNIATVTPRSAQSTSTAAAAAEKNLLGSSGAWLVILSPCNLISSTSGRAIAIESALHAHTEPHTTPSFVSSSPIETTSSSSSQQQLLLLSKQSGYYNYSLVCLHNSGPTHQYELSLKGKGPVFAASAGTDAAAGSSSIVPSACYPSTVGAITVANTAASPTFNLTSGAWGSSVPGVDSGVYTGPPGVDTGVVNSPVPGVVSIPRPRPKNQHQGRRKGDIDIYPFAVPSQSIAIGRFSVIGSDRPVVVDFISVLNDLRRSHSESSSLAVTTVSPSSSDHYSCSGSGSRRLVKVLSGVSEKRKGRFSVLPQRSFDLLYDDSFAAYAPPPPPLPPPPSSSTSSDDDACVDDGDQPPRLTDAALHRWSVSSSRGSQRAVRSSRNAAGEKQQQQLQQLRISNSNSNPDPNPNSARSDLTFSSADSTAGGSSSFFQDAVDGVGGRGEGGGGGRGGGGGGLSNQLLQEDEPPEVVLVVSRLDDVLPASPYSSAGAAQVSLVPYDRTARILIAPIPTTTAATPAAIKSNSGSSTVTAATAVAVAGQHMSASVTASERDLQSTLRNHLNYSYSTMAAGINSADTSLQLWGEIHDPAIPLPTSSSSATPQVITPVVPLPSAIVDKGLVDMLNNFRVQFNPENDLRSTPSEVQYSVIRAVVVRAPPPPPLSSDAHTPHAHTPHHSHGRSSPLSPAFIAAVTTTTTTATTTPSATKTKRRGSKTSFFPSSLSSSSGSLGTIGRQAKWVLAVLRHSDAYGFEVATWADGDWSGISYAASAAAAAAAVQGPQAQGLLPQHQKSNITNSAPTGTSSASGSDSPAASSMHVPVDQKSNVLHNLQANSNDDGAHTQSQDRDIRSRDYGDAYEGVEEASPRAYMVSVTPDRHFGLGMRLDVQNSRIIVDSFKRNPLTNAPLSAEGSGLIEVGDELLAVNENNLKGATLDEVIKAIRNVVLGSSGLEVKLTLLKPPSCQSEKSVDEQQDEERPSGLHDNLHAPYGKKYKDRMHLRSDSSDTALLSGTMSEDFDGVPGGGGSVAGGSYGSSRSTPISELLAPQYFRWQPCGVFPVDPPNDVRVSVLSADIGIHRQSGKLIVTALCTSLPLPSLTSASSSSLKAELYTYELLSRPPYSSSASSPSALQGLPGQQGGGSQLPQQQHTPAPPLGQQQTTSQTQIQTQAQPQIQIQGSFLHLSFLAKCPYDIPLEPTLSAVTNPAKQFYTLQMWHNTTTITTDITTLPTTSKSATATSSSSSPSCPNKDDLRVVLLPNVEELIDFCISVVVQPVDATAAAAYEDVVPSGVLHIPALPANAATSIVRRCTVTAKRVLIRKTRTTVHHSGTTGTATGSDTSTGTNSVSTQEKEQALSAGIIAKDSTGFTGFSTGSADREPSSSSSSSSSSSYTTVVVSCDDVLTAVPEIHVVTSIPSSMLIRLNRPAAAAAAVAAILPTAPTATPATAAGSTTAVSSIAERPPLVPRSHSNSSAAAAVTPLTLQQTSTLNTTTTTTTAAAATSYSGKPTHKRGVSLSSIGGLSTTTGTGTGNDGTAGLSSSPTTTTALNAMLLPTPKWLLLSLPALSIADGGDQRAVGTVILCDTVNSWLLRAEVHGGVGMVASSPAVTDTAALLVGSTVQTNTSSSSTNTNTTTTATGPATPSAAVATPSTKTLSSSPPTNNNLATTAVMKVLPTIALVTQVIDLAIEALPDSSNGPSISCDSPSGSYGANVAPFGVQYFKWLEGLSFQVVLRNSTTMVFRKQLDLYTAMFAPPVFCTTTTASSNSSTVLPPYAAAMQCLTGYGYARGGLWAKVALVSAGGFVGPPPFSLALPSLQPTSSIAAADASSSLALVPSSSQITAAARDTHTREHMRNTFTYHFHHSGLRQPGSYLRTHSPTDVSLGHIRVSSHPVSVSLQMFQSLAPPTPRQLSPASHSIPGSSDLSSPLSASSPASHAIPGLSDLSPEASALLVSTSHRLRVLFRCMRHLAAGAVDVDSALPAEELSNPDIPLLILLQRISMSLLPVARTYTQSSATTINVARYHAAYASLENLPTFFASSQRGNNINSNSNSSSINLSAAAAAGAAAASSGKAESERAGMLSALADNAATGNRILAPLCGPEDYVLTYVLAESLVRLVYWGARGVARKRRTSSIVSAAEMFYGNSSGSSGGGGSSSGGDAQSATRGRSRTLSDDATDEQAADAMAVKFVLSLGLDEDAIDACLLTQCDAVLRGLLEGQAGLNPKLRSNDSSGGGGGLGFSDKGGGGSAAPGHKRSSSLGLDKILKGVGADDTAMDNEGELKEGEQRGEYTGEIAASKGRIGGVTVAQCLGSASQTQLYEMLVVSVTQEATFKNVMEVAMQSVGGVNTGQQSSSDDNSSSLATAAKDDLHALGRLWSSRKLDETDVLELSSGGGAGGNFMEPSSSSSGGNGGEEDCDVLGVLYMSQVALWLHDVTPIASLIADVALHRFRKKKESIQIFLEMVVAGETDKLLRLARADRNTSGKQLLALLSFEFNTEHGRNALRKNAFALMRLRRYKHAAAAFLCAEPPMTKEACSVLCKQCNDPFTALLVARIVEHRQGPLARKGGYMLGPAARTVLIAYLLPGLLKGISNSSKANAFSTSSTLRKELLKESYGVSGVDACALAIVCAMWLQDTKLVDAVLSHCAAHGMFAHAMSSARPLFVPRVPGAFDDHEHGPQDSSKKSNAPVVSVPKSSNVFYGNASSVDLSSLAAAGAGGGGGGGAGSASYNNPNPSGSGVDIWALRRSNVSRLRLARNTSSSSIASNSSTGSASASESLTWTTSVPPPRANIFAYLPPPQSPTNHRTDGHTTHWASEALIALSHATSAGGGGTTSAGGGGASSSVFGAGVPVSAGDVINDRARNCFRAAAMVRWLYSPNRALKPHQLKMVGGAVDALVCEYGLSVERIEAAMLLSSLTTGNLPSSPAADDDSFKQSCRKALMSWRNAKTKVKIAAQAAAEEAARQAARALLQPHSQQQQSSFNNNVTVAENEDDDDVQAALARLNKMTVSTGEVQSDTTTPVLPEISRPKGLGFNLASMSSSSSAAAAGRKPPASASATVVAAAVGSALDAFDMFPPPAARPTSSSSSSGRSSMSHPPPSALDMFDTDTSSSALPAPNRRSATAIAAATAPPSALDAFDSFPPPPQRVSRPSTSSSGSVASALDMFDVPQRPPRQPSNKDTAATTTTIAPSALDMFDAPQRPARRPATADNTTAAATATAIAPSALEMFDAPQRPARRPATADNTTVAATAATTAIAPSALDMFDAPQRPARTISVAAPALLPPQETITRPTDPALQSGSYPAVESDTSSGSSLTDPALQSGSYPAVESDTSSGSESAAGSGPQQGSLNPNHSTGSSPSNHTHDVLPASPPSYMSSPNQSQEEEKELAISSSCSSEDHTLTYTNDDDGTKTISSGRGSLSSPPTAEHESASLITENSAIVSDKPTTDVQTAAACTAVGTATSASAATATVATVATTAAAADVDNVPVVNEKTITQRVRDFYEIHNPSKIGSIDSILKAYSGRETQLLDKLKKQYNAEYI